MGHKKENAEVASATIGPHINPKPFFWSLATALFLLGGVWTIGHVKDALPETGLPFAILLAILNILNIALIICFILSLFRVIGETGDLFSVLLRKLEKPDQPELRAYREAAHAVMSYLIRGGFTDQYVPIGREGILSKFEHVTIEGESADWGQITSNLGSLLTVPQVLLAGYAAEGIKYNTIEDVLARKSRLVGRAQGLLAGYVEEYFTDDSKRKNLETTKLLRDVYVDVVKNLRIHWASVDRLANDLLQQKTLSEAQAFEIIEKDIPEDLKAQAEAELSRTTTEKLREILKEIES